MKPLMNRDPYKIGLVALLVGLLLSTGIVVLSLVNFGSNTYTAVLAQSAGLRPGESVEVHGVTVGKVKKVELSDKTVIATFVMERDIKVGDQTRAAVKVATLLGTHYLEVDPLGGGSLKDGEIPLARTSVPYNLQDVIEKGTTALEQLDPVLLAKSLTETSKVFGATAEETGPALMGVARLSNLVIKRADQTGQLLRSARSVTDQLSRSSQDIIGLMKQSNLVIDEVTSRRDDIHRLLIETTRLAQSLDSIVSQTKDDVKPALTDLNTALRALNREDESLKYVIEVMAPAVRYIANATGNGPFIDLYSKPALPTDEQLCAIGNCP